MRVDIFVLVEYFQHSVDGSNDLTAQQESEFHFPRGRVVFTRTRHTLLRYPSENNPAPQAITGQVRSHLDFGTASRGASWTERGRAASSPQGFSTTSFSVQSIVVVILPGCDYIRLFRQGDASAQSCARGCEFGYRLVPCERSPVGIDAW